MSLLVSLLLPSLGKARSEAILSVCLSQQHQQYIPLISFCNDRKGAPPAGYGDAVTGLTGDPFSSTDPYRWIYCGMTQVWAKGYFDDYKICIDPGFVNHVDELAQNWQSVNLIQPVSANNQFYRLQPLGNDCNGIISWGNPTSPGYITGTYTLNLSDPDTYNWPYSEVQKFPNEKYPNAAIMLCSQSVHNFNQLTPGMPWYLLKNWDSHNRENENCMYTDGQAKRLTGVPGYVNNVYYDGSWTWQVSATDCFYGAWYWWPFANNQR
jgi:hypothetical protein